MRLSIVLVLLLAVTFAERSIATEGQPIRDDKRNHDESVAKQKGATKPRLPYIRSKYEFETHILKKEPVLPDLPSCPNCHYLTGSCAPQAKGGAAYTMMYVSRVDAAATVSWFQQTLSQLKWSVSTAGSKSLAATKQGDCVQVYANRSRRPGIGCEVLISYRMNH